MKLVRSSGKAAIIMTLTIVVFQGWLVVHTFQQHERILLRLERMETVLHNQHTSAIEYGQAEPGLVLGAESLRRCFSRIGTSNSLAARMISKRENDQNNER